MMPRCNPLRRAWPLWWIVGTLAGCAAEASGFTALSGAELHRACVAYLQASDSAEGRTCTAYLRGFVDGSNDVVVQVSAGGQRSAFRERALRTRLGRPKDARPTYCIDGTTSMDQFVRQLLAEAGSAPTREDVEASDLVVATLGRYYRCAN